MNSEEFENPVKIYRPSPFWSWNDALDPEELCWQVREFADKGFGGYFMHSRVGLATHYLSEEWMNCIRACLREGKKANVESWLYDEDAWPSGKAGGFVPAKNDDYRARYFHMKEVSAEEASIALNDASLLAIFEVHLSPSKTIERFRRIRKTEEIRSDGHLFLYKVELAERSNWNNGESYVDLLNPEVTEEFLKVTLDAYAKEFRKDFGEFMPGIFTDEPNYGGLGLVGLPWTHDMTEYFNEQNGYDILDKLPLLFFESEGFRKVRYDFWKTATQRFIEAFSKPYGERCKAYGLKLTGHYLAEDDLWRQNLRIGAAMPHYEYMQIPGIDHLGRNIGNPLTLKQCSSVAHQFGQKRILSELFGCSGQNMTFEDQKWIGDFHFCLGITFLCPHLSLYTMKGDAKRDFPPTFSYHQPYWEHFKMINDYFARASYICSQGKFHTDIIVLHPIGSAWASFTPDVQRPPELIHYHEALTKLQGDLLALHRDFDFGDEIILSRHGHIENEEFIVNEGRYKIVVVPPSLTWTKETVNLLKQFLEKGGKVLFVGETPSLIGGEPAEKQWNNILSNANAIHANADRKKIAEALNDIFPKAISILDEDGNEIEDILVHQRSEGPRHIFFLANTNRTKKHDAIIRIPEKGEVTEWDTFTGETVSAGAVTQQGNTVLKAVFHPTGSHAFVIDSSKPQTPEVPLPKIETCEEARKLPEEWRFSRLHLNSLVLDTCSYSFGDGEWSKWTPMWKVRREVKKESGLEKYEGIQPWAMKAKNIKPSKAVKLRVRTILKSNIENKQAFLVLEKASKWNLNINTKFVSTVVTEWHWDKQFTKIDVSSHIKAGQNMIELSCQYDSDTPVEDMYLIGDFGVTKVSETEYILTDEPRMLRDGDWVKQGYPFYAGTMRYETSFNLEEEPTSGEQVLIRLLEAKGTLFRVSVNEQEPIPICWQPLEADVTSFVHRGWNRLAIDVVSSLRNTFGPLHHKGGDLHFVSPGSFSNDNNWVDAYQFVPYGLIEGAEVVIRRHKQG